MTEFKKGDRVVHTNFDSGEGTVVTDPTLDALGPMADVQWDEPAHHLNTNRHRHQVSLLRPAPAPVPAALDPKAVKAGDTVTVTDGKHTIAGVVDSVRERAAQFWFRFRFGEQPDACYEVPMSLARSEAAFTLTDHQPAPEPEPEWEEGVIYLATNIHNGYRGPVLYDAMRGEGGSGLFTFILSEDEYDPTDLRDVRPAVVIDPAEVDVDGLTRAVFGAYDTGTFTLPARERNAISAGLKFLGIEVPR